MKKSIKWNTLIYSIKILTSTLFPLITFPYISRVLLPEEVGRYNFSSAVVSYFSVFAALGITTYAIKEGAKVRDNKNEIAVLSQELYSINIASTLATLFVFVLSIVVIPKFRDYVVLLLILSSGIPLTTIGTEWIFNVFEDYDYITLRSVIFQILSLILMFVFVKSPDDVEVYALITVVSSAGNNIFNYRRANRYFKHKFVITKRMKNHIIPIVILFASALASQIYVNLDTTLIGFLSSDYSVGIYSAAAKIYNVLRNVLMAAITVLTPRMAQCFLRDEGNIAYMKLLNNSAVDYIALVIPAGFGVLCIAKDAIYVISGEEYLQATSSLMILSIALIFSLLGSFIANEVLIISNQENKILCATIIGAMLNFCGNLVAIPRAGIIGAAITTVISEMVVFFLQLYYAREYLLNKGVFDAILKTLISCLPILLVANLLKLCISNLTLRAFLTMIFGVVVYAISMKLLKHPAAFDLENMIGRNK